MSMFLVIFYFFLNVVAQEVIITRCKIILYKICDAFILLRIIFLKYFDNGVLIHCHSHVCFAFGYSSLVIVTFF